MLPVKKQRREDISRSLKFDKTGVEDIRENPDKKGHWPLDTDNIREIFTEKG